MKKRFLAPSIGLVVLILAALASTLVPGPETQARPTCDCSGSYITPEQWGHGSDCLEAVHDLNNQALELARNRCGTAEVCDPSLVITLGCQEHPVGSGQYMVDGYVNHGCCVKDF